MKRCGAILLFAFLGMAFILAGSCGRDDEAMAKDVPPVKPVAGVSNVSKYTQPFELDKWVAMLDPLKITSGMDEKWQVMAEVIADAIGLNGWEQTKLEASADGPDVVVDSIVQLKDGSRDDSLSALSLDWDAVKSNVPSYFQRDGLLKLVAIGDPDGALDVMLEWVINSDSFKEVIDSIPVDETYFPIKPLLNTFKMTVKGYWYTAREDYYPMVGDALCIGMYANDDFLGWEDQYDADSFLEWSPVRVVIALELGEPGLTDAVNSALENYLPLLNDIFGFSRYDYDYDEQGRYIGRSRSEDKGLQVESQKMFGHDVHYLDFDGEFQLAWMEYGNALVISDLDTIKNIDACFNPSMPVKGLPAKFNDYIYADIDGMLDVAYHPIRDEITYEYDWWRDYGDEDIVGMADAILADLDNSVLGTMEMYDVRDGERFKTHVRMTPAMGDLLLKGYDIVGAMVSRHFNMLGFSPNCYKGPNPARHPEMPPQKPVEPPAMPRGGRSG